MKRKDIAIPVILILTLGLLIAALVPLVSPIIQRTKYESYKDDLTESFNSVSDTEKLTVRVNSETKELDQGYSSYLYSFLMGLGMGAKISNAVEPGDSEIEINFPDGGILYFGEMEVEKGARKGRKGLTVYLRKDKGKYAYCYDLANLSSIKEIVSP